MAYQTYNGTKLFSYDDSVDEKHRQYLQQKQAQQQQQKKSSNPLDSFFNWVGDTAGAIGNTIKDTVGAIASPFVTATQETKRTATEKSNKQKLDDIAKKYGFNSYNEISDDAWNNNKEMIAELQQATKENTDTLTKQAKDYKENWAVKNTANVKQGDYGANAIKTWNTLADVLTAPVSMPANIAINAGQGYLSALGDEMQGKSDLSNINWGNVAKQGTANAAAGVAGGVAGNAAGKLGGKMLGANNRLLRTGGKVLNTAPVRGAVAGAAGGATGAGLGTAFEGGTLEDVLRNSIAGAQQGAGTGAVTATGMSLLNSGVNRAKNALGRGTEQPTAEIAQEDIVNPNKQSVLDNDQGTNPYGASSLAEDTGKKTFSNKLKKAGQFVEGAQVSPTRAETREILGNRSAGEVIDTVRKRTGISDIDLQARFADEVTGKNGFLDKIQKDMLTYGEDGKPITINATKLSEDVDSIVNKNIPNATKGVDREKLINGFKEDLSNPETNGIDLANSYRKTANELVRKSKITPSGTDEAQAKVYNAMAEKIEDAFYEKLSKEQVDGMFDTAIKEARNRADLALSNKNKKISNAYNKLANEIEKTPRTVRAYRGLKKDFVDIGKLYDKNAAANQVGTRSGLSAGMVAGAMSSNPALGITTPIIMKTATPVMEDALGWVGGKMSDFGDYLGNKAINKPMTVASNTVSKVSKAVSNTDLPYALIGRLSGTEEGREAAQNPQTYANPTNLEQQLGNSAVLTGDTGYVGGTNAGAGNYGGGMATSSYGGGYNGTGNNILDRLMSGMENALNAGDVSAFSQLADIYNTMSKIYGTTTSGSSTGSQKLSATQQRANAAMNSLQRLSGMTPDLGYNLSGIPIIGDIATLGGNAYEGEAKSLAQQIGYMVSGSNIKAEEAEAIGKAYVPQPFDSEYTRQLKLQRAAEIIQQYQNGTADDTATANNYAY